MQDTEVVSAPGSMLVPGFIDSHVHFISGGAGLASVQLRDAATPEEFASRIGEFAKTAQCRRVDHVRRLGSHLWGGELPRRDWIDALTPDNPVWVYRLDGHMALANSAALELAGVDADTADVDGGTIVRYADGRPTGILKDNAMTLVKTASRKRRQPGWIAKQKRRWRMSPPTGSQRCMTWPAGRASTPIAVRNYKMG